VPLLFYKSGRHYETDFFVGRFRDTPFLVWKFLDSAGIFQTISFSDGHPFAKKRFSDGFAQYNETVG
jgi:hypothetical protein